MRHYSPGCGLAGEATRGLRAETTPSLGEGRDFSSGAFDLFLQLAPAFFDLRKLRRQCRDFIVQAKRLDGVARLQQLSVERAFLFVELSDGPLQGLDFLARVLSVP